jgi:hypothetical protein
MHLAYSAINTNHNSGPQSAGSNQHQNENELILRYQAYQTACNKYSSEIAAIQKYIPGWLPKFR